MRWTTRPTLVLHLLLLTSIPFAASADPEVHDPASQHDHSDPKSFGSRPDSHAPIGVMGDHMHHAGELMLSYRYARMRMDGNRDGTSRKSASDLFADGYAVAPRDMDMEMHVFGLMFAPTDWVTLMTMVPYVELTMNHRNAMGERFTTESKDIGDVKLSAMWRLFDDETQHVHLNTGMSFPTGPVREKDGIPMMGMTVNTTLPFPMQPGSGTWDFFPGMTYTGHTDWLSWGGQAMGTVRTGRNDAGWRAGNRVDLTSWLAMPLTDWMSLSGRVAWGWWGNVAGDEDRPPTAAMVPTADPKRRAGQRLDLLAGVNFILPLGPLGKHRIAAEGGFPAWQDLDGPQLETDWRVTVGWQLAF